MNVRIYFLVEFVVIDYFVCVILVVEYVYWLL